MARACRLQGADCIYHTLSRGDGRKDIYKSKEDRDKFREYIAKAKEFAYKRELMNRVEPEVINSVAAEQHWERAEEIRHVKKRPHPAKQVAISLLKTKTSLTNLTLIFPWPSLSLK